MFLIDLVSAISRTLPCLIGEAGACRPDPTSLFEPGIGHAVLLRRDMASGASLRAPADARRGAEVALSGADKWGMLGVGTIGRALAQTASERHGATVAFHDDAYPSAEATGCAADANFERKPLAEVLAAPVLCIVLPWLDDILALAHRHRRTPIKADSVLVAWKRTPAIERALLHLDAHYDQSVQLTTLAEVAGVSRFHLVRLFSATLGITPHRYQLLMRLARAMTMLREGTGISHIAHGVGFADHSHLDRSFRVLTGMTPTQYQQSFAA